MKVLNYILAFATLCLIGAWLSPAQQPVRIGGTVPFTCSLDNIAATLTQCQAAPAAGLKLYVTDIIATSTTTTGGTYSLQTGTGTNCGTGTAAFIPTSTTTARLSAPASTAGTVGIHLITPISAPAATEICLLGVATNTTNLQLVGFTAP